MTEFRITQRGHVLALTNTQHGELRARANAEQVCPVCGAEMVMISRTLAKRRGYPKLPKGMHHACMEHEAWCPIAD